ncbi:hypothetical protein [Wenjunlia tyrosinilytica]|uniref:Integral membrane protein n=1 Tax=Wenjunlia tyrosinilytica TaxID=1544741 RepID=A0A917ZP25_9ACTN|nr:hypothetical protein [Wenjunlia tyrosinilytica]GGO86445.1 hypothetical protein GCM10012280_22570 [Wenjunlia tyrosinilytica]
MPTFTRAAVDLRLTRAAVFSAVCVVLAAAGHGAASGGSVPLWALAAGWPAVFAVAASLAGRERSLVGIAGSLLGGQLVLHTLFRVGQNVGHGAARNQVTTGHSHPLSQLELIAARLLCPTVGHTAPSGAVPGGAHTEDLGHTALNSGAYSTTAPSEMCGVLSSAAPMIIGHLAAALAAGWFLHRGEAALWRLVHLTGRAAQVAGSALRSALALVRAMLDGTPGTASPRGLAAATAEPAGPRPALLQHCVVLRGPPALALAA